jgi:hypothetical protein
MKMRIIPILLLSALSLLACSSEVPQDNAPVTGLPWQVEQLPDGYTRVFGIMPGRSMLREAAAVIGKDMELALIVAPGEAGTLEAYYSHYAAGPITGRLILVLEVSPEQLGAMRSRAVRDGASRRYHLHPDDLAAAWQLPVAVITFAPSLDLDEAIARARFGTPEAILEAGAQQHHWLYPDLGLDLVLDSDGKDVLQYLAPHAFAAYRDGLK